MLLMHEGVHDGTNPYYCSECDRYFLRKMHFDTHMNRHNGIKPKCSNCDMSFYDVYKRNQHQKKCIIGVKPSKVQCPTCEKWFLSAWNLKKHQVVHSDVRPFICNLCGKSFKRPKDLNGHKMNCKPEHECDICGNKFPEKSLLLEHFQVDHPNEQSSTRHHCKYCPKSFTHKSDRNSHEMIHEGTNPNYCQICDRYFLKAAKLKAHIESRHSEKPKQRGSGNKIECEQCGARVRNKRELALHQRIHDGTNPYYCGLCDKHFLHKSQLQKHHQYVHCEEANYVCSTCNRRFKFDNDLKRHEKLHLKEGGKGKFGCKTCKLAFGTISTLKAHYNESKTCQSVLCTICDQRFPNARQLTRHRAKHTKSKEQGSRLSLASFSNRVKTVGTEKSHDRIYPIKCAHCGEVFNDHTLLEEHLLEIRGYTTSTVYKCQYCPNSFNNHSLLIGHVKELHQHSFALHCMVCGKGFMYPGELAKHEKEDHNTSDIKSVKDALSCILCDTKGSCLNELKNHNCSNKHTEQIQNHSKQDSDSVIRASSAKIVKTISTSTPISVSKITSEAPSPDFQIFRVDDEKGSKSVLKNYKQHQEGIRDSSIITPRSPIESKATPPIGWERFPMLGSSHTFDSLLTNHALVTSTVSSVTINRNGESTSLINPSVLSLPGLIVSAAEIANDRRQHSTSSSWTAGMGEMSTAWVLQNTGLLSAPKPIPKAKVSSVKTLSTSSEFSALSAFKSTLVSSPFTPLTASSTTSFTPLTTSLATPGTSFNSEEVAAAQLIGSRFNVEALPLWNREPIPGIFSRPTTTFQRDIFSPYIVSTSLSQKDSFPPTAISVTESVTPLPQFNTHFGIMSRIASGDSESLNLPSVPYMYPIKPHDDDS